MLLCSIAIQLLSVAALWRSIAWRSLPVFLIGGVLGMPAGVYLLLHLPIEPYRDAIGSLPRPACLVRHANEPGREALQKTRADEQPDCDCQLDPGGRGKHPFAGRAIGGAVATEMDGHAVAERREPSDRLLGED